jgi:hypothetical protein
MTTGHRADDSGARDVEATETGSYSDREAPQRMALGTVGLALALALASCGDQRQVTSRTGVGARADAPFHCPATIPNGQAPPGESSNPSDLGHGGLWTLVPVDGKLVITMTRPPPPGTVLGRFHRDGSIGTKFPWWGAESVGRHLRITGSRLDSHANPLRASVAPGLTRAPHFWASTITFPSQGCWKVTGTAGAGTLTFVLQVIRG